MRFEEWWHPEMRAGRHRPRCVQCRGGEKMLPPAAAKQAIQIRQDNRNDDSGGAQTNAQ